MLAIVPRLATLQAVVLYCEVLLLIVHDVPMLCAHVQLLHV